MAVACISPYPKQTTRPLCRYDQPRPRCAGWQNKTNITIMPEKESHLKVLRILETNPHISQRELSQALGVSLGKTNYCLKALVDKGHIKIHNFRHSNNKLAYSYLLTPHGIEQKAQMTVCYLHRKIEK